MKKTKVCSKCNKRKPRVGFHTRKGRLCGLSSRCKTCLKPIHAAWFKKNKVKKSAYNKIWFKENKEKAKWYPLKKNYGLTKEVYLEIGEKAAKKMRHL